MVVRTVRPRVEFSASFTTCLLDGLAIAPVANKRTTAVIARRAIRIGYGRGWGIASSDIDLSSFISRVVGLTRQVTEKFESRIRRVSFCAPRVRPQDSVSRHAVQMGVRRGRVGAGADPGA